MTARHTGGHGVHSPCLYHFTNFVIYETCPYYVFGAIETVRKQLKRDERVISVTDYGMGKGGERPVKQIAKRALKNKKSGQLFFRIVNYCQCKNILELGTSLGITTAYLASPDRQSRCVTMEGCPETARIARENFDLLQLRNVTTIVGDINKELPVFLAEGGELDFVFIDANHNSEAVLSYFEQCVSYASEKAVFVVDDIYWSADMEKAWKNIKEHDKVTSTIDLYHFGMVFVDPVLHKKNYKMRF